MVAQSTYYMYIKSKAALPIHLKLTQEWLQNAVDHSVEQIAPIIIISIISTEKWQDTKTKKMPCTQQRKVAHTHTIAPSPMHCLASLKVSLLCSLAHLHYSQPETVWFTQQFLCSSESITFYHGGLCNWISQCTGATYCLLAYLVQPAHPYQTYMM